ncbi:MAG: M48 family metallopeptidase [Armatimonadota bacterium]|nr:M48 family metallopeptidase [bacterium]MCS7309020.1 M48 family metallopeptidase [Armatimonadota bacterium]MDW8104516.1 M48 family metallopeptidase [Armatimonadota bacterium]MDW8289101.1 M48 family metallopeptidase [Armatimonadota bacterium]
MTRARALGRTALLFVLLAAVPLVIGCRGTNLLSKQDEIQIGKEGSAAIEREYKLDTDPARTALVQEVGQRILEGMRQVEGKRAPDFPFTFKVLDTKEVNAVSLPGGPVYVFRGLMEQVGDDTDMLAAVVAHEVAHIVARHAAKQISSSILADLAISLGTRGSAQKAATIATSLVMLQYSRDDEYDADRRAILYTHAAGYDPEGLVRFFEKLQKLEKSPMKGLLANLRTHPLTENRILRAKRQIAQLPDRTSSHAVPAQ